MRRLAVLVGLALLLGSPTPARADDDLTALIAAAYFPRTQSAELHDIAHQRAREISRDFSHDGQRDGTGEVLAFNQGFADPVAHVIQQWQGSPTHDAILSDPNYTEIGCGSFLAADGTYYAACVLRTAPAPPPRTEPAPTPAPLLPNTAVGK